GEAAAAAEIYRAVLAGRPGEVGALLGLERCLNALNRSADMIPAVQAAVVAPVPKPAIYAIAVRVWAAADQPDSVRRYAERWAALAPDDETPYREWGGALLARRDLLGARRVYLLGRERVGRPDALAPELAQLAIQSSDYPAAAQEWLLAIRRLPGYRESAVSALSRAPQAMRPEVLRLLDRDGGAAARGLSVSLRARWGDPVGAFQTLSAGLPADSAQAAEALQGFLTLLRGVSGPEAQAAQGMTLEALLRYRSAADQPRLLLEAAQAYQAAGNRAAARRMLGRLAETPGADALRVGGTVALVTVLLDDGAIAEAASRLEQIRADLPVEDYQRLQRRVALGWALAGALDQAEAVAAVDSSVDGVALRGRLRLYRGDLAGARAALKEAGPYAGTREEATQRIALLALLQAVQGDTLPPLGAAVLALDRRDTAAATSGFSTVARDQPPRGAAALQVWAGRLEAARGRTAEAERLFRAARGSDAPASAAEADLELGRLLLGTSRQTEAGEVLEHLILTFPNSALVPQARQLLNLARGQVPRT
ncbi:MAG TPA: hypothetical protein VEG33_06420, partial [Streptosporangiaceae bacterium]|nr:hypothetical protein [Streptosporangiaceae bacterium]